MKFLLDTHVFLWMAAEPERMSEKATECIMNADNTLYLSIVSLWEMQIKTQLGKLALDVPLDQLWRRQQIEAGILLLSAREEHVWELGNLPQIHRDPFDRLLIAQSQYEKMALISADGIIARYETRVVW
ncbi:MAG: type II toxin-antitoxin system VapC family toxin [Deltaproteobacteria bacterium]|nr:type II toxin-antitoxin system VapC family toxin [Deltaproteobacteria bacterium]